MSRYNNIKTIKPVNSKLNVLKTVYYPDIQESADDIIIESTNKRLDYIAYEQYGDSTLWWVIAKANGILDGSFVVPSHKVTLRIPSGISDIISQFNRLNA